MRSWIETESKNMTSIFQAMSRQQDMVNQYANWMFSTEPEIKFSNVFSPFFKNISSNMLSWIDVFSKHFAIENVTNVAFQKWFRSEEGQSAKQIVNEMFKQFISREEQASRDEHNVMESGIKQLYICLFYAYQLLVQQDYNRNDEPFNFMNGFPVEATRVVILGHEPAHVDSSGYAFHESDSESTRVLIDLINSDMILLSECLANSFHLTEDELQVTKFECSLEGLVKQGVLFMNVKLTPDEKDLLNGAWEIFTDFLLKYLSKQPTPIVFILAGKIAAKKEHLIDQSLNFCMNVYHPSFYLYGYQPDPKFDWDQNVPLINANFFIYQTVGLEKMIDWSDVRGSKPGKERRIETLARAFSDIFGSSEHDPFADYIVTIKGSKGGSDYYYFLNAYSNTMEIMPPPFA